MTGSTATTKGSRTQDRKTRAVVPAPRQSPEESPDESPQKSLGERPGPGDPQAYDAYPGVRYALEHATALRPRER